jgi:hypothetical protein
MRHTKKIVRALSLSLSLFIKAKASQCFFSKFNPGIDFSDQCPTKRENIKIVKVLSLSQKKTHIFEFLLALLLVCIPGIVRELKHHRMLSKEIFSLLDSTTALSALGARASFYTYYRYY